MTTILERGGTAAQWTVANPILANRQLGVETDKRRIKIGDGVTAWTSLDYATQDVLVTFSNAAYTVLSTDRHVAQIGTLSASRTVTLPAASSVHAGKEIVVFDASGTVTASNTIVVARSGSDTIDGGTSTTITSAYGSRRLISDGSSKWLHDSSILREGSYTAKGMVLAASAANTPVGVTVGTNNHVLTADSAQTAGVKWAAIPEVIIVAIGDETTALTTGTAKVTFRMPFAMTLTAVRASLSLVSTSGTPTFDINEGAGAGTSILSTKLTIDANEFTSTTAATAAVISDSSLADDAQITIDVDVAGTGAAGAKITLIGTRT